MFSLREITKIRLCRAAFVALCLGPSCAVVAWSLAVHSDGFRRAHERAIAAQFGVRAQLSQVSLPRPRMVLYEGLELSDPDSHQLLARLPFVELTSEGDLLRVKLPYPAIVNGMRLDAFWRLAHDQFRPAQSWRRMCFEADNVTLHLADGDESFTELDAQVDNGDDQSRLKLTFRRALAGPRPAEGAELTIVERRSESATANGTLQLITGPTPLPCSLVASIWPVVAQVGKACEFQGTIAAGVEEDHWRAQLRGQLSRIDLNLLVSRHFRHKLTGLADASLELVTIENGRIEAAAGKLTAGPGVIGRSLVESAASCLQTRATAEAVKTEARTLAYTHLQAAFQISAAGLALRGALPQLPGALVANDRTALVLEPLAPMQSVLNLVRALVPVSEVQVPATRETDFLTRSLPIPSAAPLEGSEEREPRARLMGSRPTTLK